MPVSFLRFQLFDILRLYLLFIDSPVVVGHGSQSMMGLTLDSSSVAINLRTARISKSKKNTQLQELEITKMEVSPILVVLCLDLNI